MRYVIEGQRTPKIYVRERGKSGKIKTFETKEKAYEHIRHQCSLGIYKVKPTNKYSQEELVLKVHGDLTVSERMGFVNFLSEFKPD